jgi:hypothetical protein
MDIAIAFLVFNRPDLTARVFARIAAARPRTLLVVADGPRHTDDRPLCEAVRRLLERVDWPCDMRRNYADANLGCRRRIASGLDWVFREVEEAVILEDDCLPDPTFFAFCAELLERYRHDGRIMHIGGNTFVRRPHTPYSYYFSRYPHIWGWATWRRAWQYYDLEMKTWPRFKAEGRMAQVTGDPREQEDYARLFDSMHAGRINTWDYAWNYACWAQSGLAIAPSRNLVSNIGFRPDATHVGEQTRVANLPTYALASLRHPPEVARDDASDRETYEFLFHWRPSLIERLRTRVLSPWRYSQVIRRVPVAGGWWAAWRARRKEGRRGMTLSAQETDGRGAEPVARDLRARAGGGRGA